MKQYVYKAKDGPDRVVEGKLLAESRSAAVARIGEMGLSPIWVALEGEEPGTPAGGTDRGIRTRDVNVLTRQLASMLKAGVPILRALATVQEQTRSVRLQRVVADLALAVRDGGMLSEAMQRHPAVFPGLYVNIVRAGESGGVLDQMLLWLAESRELEEEVTGRVRAAATYPVFILGVGVLSVFLMMSFFLPRILAILQHTRQVLPLPTRILMAVSGFFAHSWYWILLFAAILALLVYRWIVSERGRMAWARLSLRLPLVGPLVRESDLARFGRTLGLLLRTGIPIDRALDLSGATMRNAALHEDLRWIRSETVEKGMPLSHGLRRSRHFPLFVANMVAVGEETGNMEDTLAEMASFYQRDLDRQIKTVTSLLEPVLILAVGLVVGFIIFAALLPVFQIGQAVS